MTCVKGLRRPPLRVFQGRYGVQAGGGCERSGGNMLHIMNGLKIASRMVIMPVICIVIGLALMPNRIEMPPMMSWHVANHIMAFAVIAGLLRLAWPFQPWALAFLAANGIGVLIEIMQGALTSDRTPSVFDLSINLLGAGIGVVCAGLLLWGLGASGSSRAS